MRTIFRLLAASLLAFATFPAQAQLEYKYSSSIGGTTNIISSFLFDTDQYNTVHVLESKRGLTQLIEYYQIKRFNSSSNLTDSIRLSFGILPIINIPQIIVFRCAGNGNYYALTTLNTFLAFNAKGELLFSKDLMTEPGLLDIVLYPGINAREMAIGNNMIHILSANYVFLFNLNGLYIDRWQTGEQFYPEKMAVDSKGNTYVLGYNTIVMFDTDHEMIKDIYISSNNTISGIYPDSKDRIFITYASPANYYVDVFDTSGSWLGSISGHTITDAQTNEEVFLGFRTLGQVIYQNDKLYIADLQSVNLGMRVANYAYDRIAVYAKEKLPPMGLYGPQRIPINTPVTYQILPKRDNIYPYCWYTGKNMSRTASTDPHNGNSGEDYMNITLIASAETTPGRLVCLYYTNNGEDSVYVDITPYSPDKPYAIASVTCDTRDYILCSDGNIESFQFSDLIKTGMECEVFSYKDFTLDSITANANIGQLYNATLSLTTLDPSIAYYAGIWIDLNNDGDFDDADEFSGTAIAFEGQVKFLNIHIPHTSDYTGNVRMRLRSRSLYPFSADEACIRPGDSGETQDYAVHLTQPVTLAASEAITPNNDGKNDHFVVKGIDPLYNNKLIITDAYGKVVKETDNYMNDWPGQNEHSTVPKGTYYFFFENGPGSINGFFIINY